MNTQISSLIEDQLPGFIVSEYENFQKVLESYYENLESTGNPLDIITNLTSYYDIDFYEKKLLQERTTLSSSLNSTDTTIIVADASSFPLKNGYVKIDNEICFYKERTSTELLEVSRGVSGTTQLGDLYSKSKFVSSDSTTHDNGSNVDNLSHLFLYAIVKSFEIQYLESFPEEYIKKDVDKRILIKNISNFYKVKGTDKSIRFLFNTIVSDNDTPTTYNPKDQTLKASVSDWDSSYVIQCRILSGNPEWLIGQTVIQQSDNNANVNYASAVIENFYTVDSNNGDQLFNLIVNPQSINSEFVIPQRTVLNRIIVPGQTTGDTITVDSTFGWDDSNGVIVINDEVISYEGKNARQFIIKNRGTINRTHNVGDEVTNYSTLKSVTPNGIVSLLAYGTLNTLLIDDAHPYASVNDRIQVSNPGFESANPLLFSDSDKNYRWKVNVTGDSPSVPLNPSVGQALAKVLAGIGSIYEDNDLYYFATSSYPSTRILPSGVTETLSDPQLLKIIPKATTTTSEIYKTPRRDIGLFVDGSIAFGFKNEDLIQYGPITEFVVTRRGSGYQKPPFILINGVSHKADAILTGDTVSDIISTDSTNYTSAPTVEIVSGRDAVLEPIVTSGEITSIRIVNPGEYYSASPAILISDFSGKGRFAEYHAVVSPQGQITSLEKLSGGKFYTQENVVVTVIPDAFSNSAAAKANIREWVKNRHFNTVVDDNGGLVVPGYNRDKNYYGVISNPKRLRLRLNDNVATTTLVETTAAKTHSPILGYAYDGNPIYGPYGYENPLNPSSDIAKMESGYSIKSSRVGGPIDAPYEMGTFVDDYEWSPTVDTGKTRLDVNNGRFCVTPEFPRGVYAYFLTIDATGIPVFPYIIGENYYSLPVKSNYQSDVTQNAIPKEAKRLFITGTEQNGKSEIAIIDSISRGSVSGVTVEDSQPNFSVGSRVYVNNAGTGGTGATGRVSATFGKPVTSLESRETKASVLTSAQPFYSFSGDTITQPSTGATGELLRDTIEENTFVLRAINNAFESGSPIESSSTVLNILLNKSSTYTKDVTLDLVLLDDPSNVIASSLVLSSTIDQNSVRVKVISGNFSDYLNYDEGKTILKSGDLANTAGSGIVAITNLSQGVDITSVNESIAIAETVGVHDFAEGDDVDIQIDPDESVTETLYYVAKKDYQEVDLTPQSFLGKVNDTGVGDSTMVGLGRDYAGGVYNNVELIFSNFTNVRETVGSAGDSDNARATVTVNTTNFDGSGQIESIVITDGGSGYTSDDILTVNPSSIAKADPTLFDTDIDPTMVQLNASEISLYEIGFFQVDSADKAAVIAFVGAVNDIFIDSNGVEHIYLGEDTDNDWFEYRTTVPGELIDTSVTIDSVVVTASGNTSGPGAPLPQFRFDVGGEINPGYDLRVGSTFTVNPIPGHVIWIVSDYSTTIRQEDGVALEIATYIAASGVTNNGSSDETQTITFTPQAPGTYHYICISHPEMVGELTVYPAPSTAIPLVSVNAVGLGVQRTEIVLDKIFSLAENDLLSVGSEIVRVTSVDSNTRQVSLERGVGGTNAVNHLPNSVVTSYQPKYRFTPGTQIIGNTVNDPYVVSYNETTHRLVVNYGFDATNPNEITLVSSFPDQSVPTKITSVSNVDPLDDRLLFSLDNTNFLTNPIVDIQKYYFYKFDTSHPSMLGSYLDISTSSNYNVFTEEKEVGLAEPGNAGSFVRIRLGYGANIGDIKRKNVNYTTYYYFLTNSSTNTNSSFLRVKEDPLAGRKRVVFTTDTKFVYSLDDVPQYDGSGNIQYKGRSVGKIASIVLDNLGENYKSLPSVEGVVPAAGYKADVKAVRDASSNSITKIDIDFAGQNYSKPKAYVSGDGTGLELAVKIDNGIVTAVEILNPGKDYYSTPKIDIIETDNKLFFESNDIGIPQSIRFINNGTFYFKDDSIQSYYETPQVLTLSNFELNAFGDGESIEQKINGVVFASGKVASNGWNKGSNILRLVNISGVFREGYPINGRSKGKTANVISVTKTSFTPVINTRTRTIGKFSSDRGKLSSVNQRITDSNFYQDYSYVVRSKTPINNWRNVVKDNTHPAGFKMFGEVYIESSADIKMKGEQSSSEKLTNYLILPTTAVSSYTSRRTITTGIIKVEDSTIVRGAGSASVDSFDETLTRVREIVLSPEFDGRYDDSTGLKIGNRTFTLKDKNSGTAFTPKNNQSIMITIDGVAQNPGRSYKINGNQITFYEPPIGKRQQLVDGNIVDVPAQSYYIRGFQFREDVDNNKYLKKLKDITNNFDGRTRIFDLFYEDNSVVKSDKNENFLIYLNAVLQQGSYEIRRFNSSAKTDQIVFSKAPKNYKDLYEGVPDQLQNEEYFFGYSVGSYERLGINNKLIPFNGASYPYPILDTYGRVKNFDTPLYAYVFVDGVLQRDSLSYRINGSSITFENPLGYAKQPDGSYTTATVDILYFYGKDYNSTVTLFDFENDTYFNRTTVTFTGAGTRDQVDSWFKQNTSYKTTVYQIVGGTQRVWGEVIDIGLSNGDDWEMFIRSQNVDLIPDEPVYFSRRTVAGTTDTISVSFDSFSISYLLSEQNERLLNRVESNYSPFITTSDLIDSYEYKGIVIKEHPNLRVGDFIQIDGESEKREVFSVPLFAKTKEYRPGEQVSNNYFSKISVGSYNKDKKGEGLSVTANVADGVVVSLDWNKRDLQQYFDNNILINPTAYQYNSPPVLNFVPSTPAGGGARAEVLVYGGQVIDIVLVDGGSGYAIAPRVLISRGYNVVRENNYPESSFDLKLKAQDGIYGVVKMQSIFSEVYLWDRNLMESLTAVVSLSPVDATEILTCFVTPDPLVVTFNTTQFENTSTVETTIQSNNLSWNETTVEVDYEIIKDLSYSTYLNPVTKYHQSGVLDLNNNPMGDTEYLYSHYLPGKSVRDFIESLYIDVGYANVSGITLEQLDTTFSEFKSIDNGNDTWIQNYAITDSNISTTGRVLNFAIPSIQELASYLDADLLIGDTFQIDIPDTTNFPSSGKLIVGKEIISYTSKVGTDRLSGITRALNGTTEVDHPAGSILRTIGIETTT